MITLLKNWSGAVEINGTHYDSMERAISDFKSVSGDICIKLLHSHEKRVSERSESVKSEGNERVSTNIETTRTDDGRFVPRTVYQITVRQYMTKKASPDFDFMAKFNNDRPMPLRTMIGTVEKETKGMVYMNLTGMGLSTCTCMRCGRELTNPISRHYGIGPECMAKLGLIREIDDVEGIKEDLSELEWSGWVIKSAITDKTIYTSNT